jgi:hypothetical protein
LESLKVLHTVVGNGAKNKFGSCWQWREWNNLGLLFSFTNSRYELSPPLAVALEASHRRCQERDDAFSEHSLKKLSEETSANTPRFSYPYGAMNFHGRVGN